MPKPSERLVPNRQRPLRHRYQDEPQAACIQDHARALTGGHTDAFHGCVEPASNGATPWEYGIHRAVGGDHDAPNPGDLLCAAQAACLHSTTRMLAQWLDIELTDVEVDVTAEIDVRGTLMVAPSAPVGFQRIRCDVRLQLPADTPGEAVKALMKSAERCCPVMQTLAGGTEVVTDWHFDQELDTSPADDQRDSTTGKEAQS